MNKQPLLKLQIFDYNNHCVCPIYDSKTRVSGEGYSIKVQSQRNGWKEISFSIPSVIQTEQGTQKNYRLNYLIADYSLRLQDQNGKDQFIINETNITHKGFSKTVQITAGHVSQMLKLKNLGLQFSDEQGNNTGTADELLTTILDGTGWSVGYVEEFLQKRIDPQTGEYPVKRRSLKASAKTGAFKLISLMCQLFDAKPIYHGYEKTVDIVAINPFSKPQNGQLPDLTKANGVLQMHYDKSLKSVSRKLNTQNLITKLYAYGSYGDDTLGYCNISECNHLQYKFTLKDGLKAGNEYWFSVIDPSGMQIIRSFTVDRDYVRNDYFKYSFLDEASTSYVYFQKQQRAQFVRSGTHGSQVIAKVQKEQVQNLFSFILNFQYYHEVGLFNEEHLQKLAKLQYNGGSYLSTIRDNTAAMLQTQNILTDTIGSIDFVKLDVEQVDYSQPYIRIKLNKEKYEDGCIYRTDYLVKKDKRFEWRITQQLQNEQGDPKNDAASIVYIVHDTDPVTWDKGYLKLMQNDNGQTVQKYQNNPDWLTLWLQSKKCKIDPVNDRVYLFAQYNINGKLGAQQVNEQSAKQALQSATTIATAKHPVVFYNVSNINSDPNYSLTHISYLPKPPEVIFSDGGYGWLWAYNDLHTQPFLFFCYGANGDKTWHRMYVSYDDPTDQYTNDGDYFYQRGRSSYGNVGGSCYYVRKNNEWVIQNSDVQQSLCKYFGTVYKQCMRIRRYYEGISEFFTYNVDNKGLPVGRYYIQSQYDNYFLFEIQTALYEGDKIQYDVSDGWLTVTSQDVQTNYKPKIASGDSVVYHKQNYFDKVSWQKGVISSSTGIPSSSTTYVRTTGYSSIVQNAQYKYTSSISGVNQYIIWYSSKKTFISSTKITGTSVVKAPAGASYFKITVKSTSNPTITITPTKNNSLMYSDVEYVKLQNIVQSGQNKGLINYIKRFADNADATYDQKVVRIVQSQNAYDQLQSNIQSSIGNMWRQGYWQKTDYVDGDQDKLYDDALQNLKQVSYPQATYNIDFLDLYGSDSKQLQFNSYGERGMEIPWNNIDQSSAVHIVDPQININIWAYIDKLQKCYDDPRDTKISVNTNLSTISQHSFGDVFSNIANVASNLNASQTKIGKTTSNSGFIISGGNAITILNNNGQKIFHGDKDGIKFTSGIMQLGQDSKKYLDADGVLQFGNICINGNNNTIRLNDQTTISMGSVIYTSKQIADALKQITGAVQSIDQIRTRQESGGAHSGMITSQILANARAQSASSILVIFNIPLSVGKVTQVSPASQFNIKSTQDNLCAQVAAYSGTEITQEVFNNNIIATIGEQTALGLPVRFTLTNGGNWCKSGSSASIVSGATYLITGTWQFTLQ